MSIDIPHGGGSDTPASQDIGPNIKKPSLPYGVSQKHWDEAGRIIREASNEVAQTLGEDGMPLGTIESRITKNFEESQLRVEEICKKNKDTIMLLTFPLELDKLLKEHQQCENEGERYSLLQMNYGMDYKCKSIENSEKKNTILNQIYDLLILYYDKFIQTSSPEFLLLFMSACNKTQKLIKDGFFTALLRNNDIEPICLTTITHILINLIQKYHQDGNPKIKADYETIYDFAVKYKLLVQINNNLPRGFKLHREINKNSIQNYRGGLKIRA